VAGIHKAVKTIAASKRHFISVIIEGFSSASKSALYL